MNYSDFTRRPISSESPTGTNPNNLNEFSELKRQINGLNKVVASVSWKRVHELSSLILQKHSKDFRCACYYTVSALHINGLKGLIDGLNAICDLTVVYWHTAYPEVSKPSARTGAIEWMLEHSVKKLKKTRFTENDLHLLETGHHLTLKIEEEVRQHLGVKSPSLGPIRRIFSDGTEQIKAQQALAKKKQEQEQKQRIEEKVTPAPSVPADRITVQVQTQKPQKQNAPDEKKPEPKSSAKPLLIAALFLLVTLFSYFSYQQYYVTRQKAELNNADIIQFQFLLTSLSQKDESLLISVKPVVINRAKHLFSGWDKDPEKIHHVHELSSIVRILNELYPDSSSSQQLSASFASQRSDIEAQYKALTNKFSHARTAIANATLNPDGSDPDIAYNYSNTLFPLLGRIEYAEKEQSRQTLEKAQSLLNVYQYKLNQLAESFKEQNSR